MTMLAESKWIRCEERNPDKYGKYRVICIQKGQHTEDEYLWNGSNWVTPKGSPSKGVQSWRQTAEAPAVRTESRALSLADYEARIRIYREQIGTGYIGIGRTLNEAKEAKVVPHGQWETWVTETTGLTPRQAQRCMQAATEIREGSAMAQLEMSKALLLLSSGLDEEQRETVAEKVVEEGATVKQLREELKQAKLKAVDASGAAAEIRIQLKRAEEEKKSLSQQMEATIQGYQKRLDEVEGDAYRRGMADHADGLKQEIRKEFQSEMMQLRHDLEMNRQRRQSLQDQLKNEREAAGREAFGLRNELNKQTQYAESLREELEKNREAYKAAAQALSEARETVPEGVALEMEQLKREREEILDAAALAEQRAADAEAQLEAFRASGGTGGKEPAWKVIRVAMERFMTDCEMLPVTEAREILREEDKIRSYLEVMESWIRMVRDVFAGVVTGEGAVR